MNILSISTQNFCFSQKKSIRQSSDCYTQLRHALNYFFFPLFFYFLSFFLFVFFLYLFNLCSFFFSLFSLFILLLHLFLSYSNSSSSSSFYSSTAFNFFLRFLRKCLLDFFFCHYIFFISPIVTFSLQRSGILSSRLFILFSHHFHN